MNPAKDNKEEIKEETKEDDKTEIENKDEKVEDQVNPIGPVQQEPEIDDNVQISENPEPTEIKKEDSQISSQKVSVDNEASEEPEEEDLAPEPSQENQEIPATKTEIVDEEPNENSDTEELDENTEDQEAIVSADLVIEKDEIKPKSGGSSSLLYTFTMFLLAVVSMCILLSCYYRFHLLKHKRAPFNAPRSLKPLFPTPVNYEYEISELCNKYMTN